MIPSVYDTYKVCGRNPIECMEKDDYLDAFSSDEIDLMIDVAMEYGRFSTSALVSFSHADGTPWAETYDPGQPGKAIPVESMGRYFSGMPPIARHSAADDPRIERYCSPFPDGRIVVMCTGSQGEPLSALSRMANGEHKTLSIHEGDTVIISATPVPGNEKAVQQVINSLAKLGCDVYDKSRKLVHVSGHGSQEELKLMIAMAKPTYFMPVHGEAVHLRAHAGLARKMGIAEDRIFVLDNGDTLEMRGGIAKVGPAVESGVVYVDGLRIGDTDPIVLRDRQKLANDGMVTVVATISQKRKQIDAVEFSGRGVSFPIDDDFADDCRASIMKMVEKGKFTFTSSGTDALRKAVRDSVSNFIWNRTRTRPMIIPVVMEV